MPRALDPARATFDVWLAEDEATEKPKRPVFIAKRATGRRAMELADLYDKMAEATKGSAALAGVYAELGKQIIDWRNMGEFGDYDPDKLPDLLEMGEAMELFERIIAGMSPEATDLGKSDSQP